MAYTDHVGDIFKVVAAFTYPNGQVEEFGIHYQILAAGAGDSRPAVLGYMDSGVAVYLNTTYPPSVKYYGSQISTVKALAKFGAVVSYINTVGSGGAGFAPTQCRGLISWKTQYSGRAYRGRTFLPTPSVANVTTDGKPQPAIVSTWGGFAGYIIGAITSGGTTWVPGIYHKKPTADISAVFTQYEHGIVNNEFATQRRSGGLGRVNAPPF